MRRDEAVIKPVNTECPRKLAKTPSFRNPIRNEIIPENIEMFKHNWMYSGDPSAKLEVALAVVPSTSDVIAKGPMDICFEVPSRTYMNIGMLAV